MFAPKGQNRDNLKVGLIKTASLDTKCDNQNY